MAPARVGLAVEIDTTGDANAYQSRQMRHVGRGARLRPRRAPALDLRTNHCQVEQLRMLRREARVDGESVARYRDDVSVLCLAFKAFLFRPGSVPLRAPRARRGAHPDSRSR